LTGEELTEKRNVLVESARIARGAVGDLAKATIDDFDALVVPGGFGAAKNLNQWAISGPEGTIKEDVKHLILNMVKAPSPYDIEGISKGLNDIGALVTMATIEEVIVDHTNKIVTAPCYMMEASVSAVRENIAMAIVELINLTQKEA